MATKKKGIPERASTRRKKPAGISIRMYNVGFGDCFLVTIGGTAGTPTRILFDCGSIGAAPDISIDDVLKQLWRDATDPGASNPRIDVVVATHRHRDHVSGFARPGWEKVQVGEVWMPWTEDPEDELARTIRDRQSRLAAQLNMALAARLASPGLAPAAAAQLTSFQEIAMNALSNESAMTTLHEGFLGKPRKRFLPEKDQEPTVIEFPNVTAYVIGPSRDKEVIRDMDPPQGQSYLKIAETSSGQKTASEPFSREWQIDRGTWEEAVKPVQPPTAPGEVSRLLGRREFLTWRVPPVFSAEDQKGIAEIGELEQAIAVSLDKAVNGTSLMIVLKIGQNYLLFPGDAQWGSWDAALRNAQSRRLLSRTKFYKVGHHGSHNATPVEFVENVLPAEDLPAMVSTRPIAQWPDIPREQLLDRLAELGCKYARSDKSKEADAKVFRPSADGLFIDVAIT